MHWSYYSTLQATENRDPARKHQKHPHLLLYIYVLLSHMIRYDIQ